MTEHDKTEHELPNGDVLIQDSTRAPGGRGGVPPGRGGVRARGPRGPRAAAKPPPDAGSLLGVEADGDGIPVDAQLRAGERLWAVGDVTGIWPLTHVGKYQGDVVAANLLGEPREAHYDAVPRVTYTDPQAASVGSGEARFSATSRVAEVAKTATYTHAYAADNGFLTLLSDGERLTGASALGPEGASGCSRPRSRSAPACRSTSWPTPSSPSRPSRRSTSAR